MTVTPSLPPDRSRLTRRGFACSAIALTSASLAGCSGMSDLPVIGSVFDPRTTPKADTTGTLSRPNYAQTYGRFPGEPYGVQPFQYARVDPVLLRQDVVFPGGEEPGTIVVDPKERFLYHVTSPGRATRYGVGVGREGFGWTGWAQINMKRTWPDWVPPKEMVERDPDVRSQLVRTARGLGVPGGPASPLGARAMYLFNERGDTGYRIHGTLEPYTIGTDVSSGCIRMVNQDVIHLYAHAPDGTRVHVLGA